MSATIHSIEPIIEALRRLDELVGKYPELTAKSAQERLEQYLEGGNMGKTTLTKNLMVRTDEAFLADIDEKLIPALEAMNPGLRVNRSDAIRYAVQATIQSLSKAKDKGQ